MKLLPEKFEVPLQPNLFLGHGVDVKKKSKTPLLVGGVLVAAICIIFGFVIHLFFGKTLPVPENTIALAYITSDIKLPDSAPRLWRDAQKTSDNFPFFVGYVQTDNGLEPFEITAGILDWKLTAPEYTSAPYIKLSEVPLRARDLFKDSWLGVWPAQRSMDSESAIIGSIQDNRWETSLKATSLKSEITVRTPGFELVDVKALPGQWPRLKNMFIGHGLPLYLDQEPSVVEWKNSDELSVVLHFENEISEEDAVSVAAAVELTEKKVFLLEDGTVAVELRALNEIGDEEYQLDGGRVLRVSEKRVFIGVPENDISEDLASPCGEGDAGSVIAVFNKETVSDFFLGLYLPKIELGEFIYFVENKEKIDICW